LLVIEDLKFRAASEGLRDFLDRPPRRLRAAEIKHGDARRPFACLGRCD
jgi:hypothetical protein